MMTPRLSLAGLNRLRGVIALVSGAIAAGLSYFSRSVEGGPALADQAMLSGLWIYVGVTAVPWASLKGMAGSGITSALAIGAWTVYLTAVAGFTGWSVAEHEAWHQPPPIVRPPRCVPDTTPAPASINTTGVVRPAPLADATAPVRPTPLAETAAPDASQTPAATGDSGAAALTDVVVLADAAVLTDAEVLTDASGDAATTPEGRHRSRRHRHDDEEDDDTTTPPAVWLERDQARPQG